jgi:hypothetical protein
MTSVSPFNFFAHDTSNPAGTARFGFRSTSAASKLEVWMLKVSRDAFEALQSFFATGMLA